MALFDKSKGKRKDLHYDAINDEFVLETREDVTDIVEVNRAARNLTEAHTPYGDINRVGSIPVAMFYDMMARGEIDQHGQSNNDERLLKFLMDPTNKDFKTRNGSFIHQPKVKSSATTKIK